MKVGKLKFCKRISLLNCKLKMKLWWEQNEKEKKGKKIFFGFCFVFGFPYTMVFLKCAKRQNMFIGHSSNLLKVKIKRGGHKSDFCDSLSLSLLLLP